MPFVKGVVTNPTGRPKGARDKSKKKIRDAINNILDDNISRVVKELKGLSGKDFLEFYTKFLEYGLPKLQRQIIEIDPETIVRGWQIIPASAVKINGKELDHSKEEEK